MCCAVFLFYVQWHLRVNAKYFNTALWEHVIYNRVEQSETQILGRGYIKRKGPVVLIQEILYVC